MKNFRKYKHFIRLVKLSDKKEVWSKFERTKLKTKTELSSESNQQPTIYADDTVIIKRQSKHYKLLREEFELSINRNKTRKEIRRL